MKPLRVTVTCAGKFHAFALSAQLARRGMLERLLTTDPRAWLEPGLPRGRVLPVPAPELLSRLPRRLGVVDDRRWIHRKVRAFDYAAQFLVGDPDVVVAWSGGARRTLARAKEAGRLTIVERGSSHIEHQNAVLVEEYARFSWPIQPILPEGIRNELAEYALADRIMVPSSYAKRTFVARGVPEEKLLQVPYGADTGRFRPGTQEDDVFRVAFVGAISLQKGIYYLLEAMKRLALPRSELVLIGPVLPEMRDVLSRYSGTFRATGPMTHAEIAGMLRQSTVFAFPSLQEGLSLALREAHATGLPIVATDASGAEDVIVHGTDGFVVPARGIDEMAAGLERLYREPALRAAMREAAIRRSRAWTWQDYGDAVVEAYRGALDAARR